MMVLKHDQSGDEIKKIRKLSNEFTAGRYMRSLRSA